MKKSRFTEEQIIAAIRSQVSRQKSVEQICREMGLSQATFYLWKMQYGGMTAPEAKRLRALESENARLKKLLSERTLELDTLQDVLKKLWGLPAAESFSKPWSVTGVCRFAPVAVWPESVEII
jgi:putative transposase